jgi:sugar/nucleoside kinase (ribokinase family)
LSGNIEKIIVIGSIVVDEIHTSGGDKIESFGGITYSIITLSKLLKNTTIIPISYIGRREYPSYEKILSPFTNIDLSFLKIFEGGSNRNLLIYREDGEREEFFRKVTPPIEIESLLPHLDADAALINYIKNDDLPFEILKTFSYAFRGVLYIDFHSLLREVNGMGRFVLRTIPNWQRWIPMGDILQMNREEAETLTGIELKSIEDIKNLSLLLLGFGCRVINITLGGDGVVVSWKREGKRYSKHIPAPKVKVLDPTGCGDVYGASFLVEYLKTGEPLKSAVFAVGEAATSATRRGLGLENNID